MREITDVTGELFLAMQPRDILNGWSPSSWFSSIVRSLGLTGWGQWLLQIGLSIITGLLFLMIGIAIVKCMISRLISSNSSVFSPSVHYVRITIPKDDDFLDHGVADILDIKITTLDEAKPSV